ncbi:MAG: putative lipid II flippase FtsW [Clostridiales bacterium]|jgi:cell division protein FtsW|nr:putative lipid II flippase FtsW [Clostridiales bacterium]
MDFKLRKLDLKTPKGGGPPIKGRGADWVLLAVAAFLVLFGILMVYSASSYAAEKQYGDKFFYLKKQVLGAALGGLAMLGTSRLPYRVYKRLNYPILIVSFALLGVVFIPGVGVENYGARRWINLPGFTLQASELAKFGFVIFAAAYMSKHPERMRKFWGVLPVLGAGGAMCALIIAEPNMSITMVVCIVMLIMLFAGGMRVKHFIMAALPLAAAVPLLIVMEPYRMNRLAAFLNPWASPLGEGFQLIQSYYSLGAGGWFGLGLFNSRQKYLFLPFSESDFIFSIIGEELGFVGAAFIILAYILLIWRAARIALRAKDRFGCYLATGIAAVLGVQVLVNLAVVTGSIPPTGLPLPFISAGSSSLIVFMAATGVVLNISRR